MVTQKDTLAKLVADVELLKAVVASLPKQEVKEEPKVEVSVPVPDYPIPQDFKDIVETTLNKSFKVRLEPMRDSPSFLFSIVVPPKYSKASGEDLRPKVITNSEGVVGVRMWAEKVFNHFDSEMQALIAQDRPFVESAI